MTETWQLDPTSTLSATPEHVRVSVVGSRTQLDLALPLDVAVASMVPELVKLMHTRDAEAPADVRGTDPPRTVWVLSRFDAASPLQPSDTLRAAGIVDGDLLLLAAQRALVAPTLYDDVVDAAARLNKEAHPGWNAGAARWMALGGLGLAALMWVYLVVVAHDPLIVGMAAAIVALMIASAALAHRFYGQRDIGAVLGWCTIPVGAAIVWVLVHGFGGYGAVVGCALLVVLNAIWYWVIGTGRWGYLASGVPFAAGAVAMLAHHALAVSTQVVGAALAIVAAIACLLVSWLTNKLAAFASPTASADGDPQRLTFENPFAAQPAATGGEVGGAAGAVLPTAEAVWARVRAAQLGRSALYTGLAVSVLAGAVAVVRAEPEVRWVALVFVMVCAVVLGTQAEAACSGLERVSLGAPAVALVVLGGVCAQAGSAAMAWAGYGALLAVAVASAVIALSLRWRACCSGWATTVAYVRYVAYGALIPVALWAVGAFGQLM